LAAVIEPVSSETIRTKVSLIWRRWIRSTPAARAYRFIFWAKQCEESGVPDARLPPGSGREPGRGSAWGFLAKTTDPRRALRNLLECARMFTDALREETARLGLPTVEVDAKTTEDEFAEQVMDVFGL
jgi:hypothetical protein